MSWVCIQSLIYCIVFLGAIELHCCQKTPNQNTSVSYKVAPADTFLYYHEHTHTHCTNAPYTINQLLTILKIVLNRTWLFFLFKKKGLVISFASSLKHALSCSVLQVSACYCQGDILWNCSRAFLHSKVSHILTEANHRSNPLCLCATVL